jgi:hypothetical protein
MVPPRLEKNAPLRRQMAEGLALGWTQQGPAPVPTMTVPFESEKIDRLFEFIAKGLAWHHFHQTIGPEAIAWAGLLTAFGEAHFEQWFAPKANVRINQSLGGGTFTYEGAQSDDDPKITIWRFTVYGGASFCGDPDVSWERNSRIGALTGSERLIARLTAPPQTLVGASREVENST